MNNEKMGIFIKELRRKHKYSQQALADLVPVTREAVSKWECGVNYPDSSSLLRLSEIFNVSINELLYGEKENKNNKKEISKITMDLYEENNKKSKKLKLLAGALILTIILFLAYYFMNTFNTFKIYLINYSDNDITIKSGMLITTKEKVYLRLGDINTDKEITNLRLYFKDKGKDNLIIETDELNIELYEYLGYNNYFDFDDLNKILKNTYLDIYFDDEVKTIKIDYQRDFANDYVKPKKDVSSQDDMTSNISNEEFESKIINKFKYENNVYSFAAKDLKYTYLKDFHLINLIQKSKDISREWRYNINFQTCEYLEYDSEGIINNYVYKDGLIECNIDNCDKNEDNIKFFFDKLSSILQ